MNRMDSISIGPWVLMMALGLVLQAANPANNCYAENFHLVLRQTPSFAGQIEPKPGMYDFEPGTEVTLIANPSRNCRFVRWLGDVADPEANKTVAYLDQTKVIIALFEMTVNNVGDTEDTVSSTAGRAGSSGGFFRSNRVIATGAGTAGDAPPPRNSGNDPSYTMPIPEPGTIALLITGAILIRKRLKQITKRNLPHQI